MNLKDQRVLVVGTGISGIAACELLLAKEAHPILFDGNENLDVSKLYENAPQLKEIPLVLGTLTQELMEELDLVVLSPGVPTDIPMVLELKAKNLPVWGEIELAYQCGHGRIIGITGTNGKTTTTALTGEILRSYYKDVRVVGNIGIPYTKEALTMTDDTVIAAEISSFQLETVKDFAPEVTGILNITPDHLNRHHTMEAYIEAKESITANQTKDQTCVLNYEDSVLREFGMNLKANVVFFSSKTKLENGYFLEDGVIKKATDGEVQSLVDVEELQLLGNHNYENVMAAMAMTEAFGVPMDHIIDTAKRFTAVEHRIEYVCDRNGVKYYNDSKGTNPDAAIQGIRAMNRKTYLIGGGYDKQSEYDEWIEAFDGKVRKLVLIGQTREKIAQCAKKHGFMDVVLKDSLEEAIDYCYEHAKEGEAVLLSPACASWGMFPNYEERGRIFKEYVRNLKG